MSNKLRATLAVVLLCGSASTVVAASNGAKAHTRSSHRAIASQALSREGFAGAVSQWRGRTMCDDGGGRIRPCDFAGCGGG
jgi:hypothetical protein